MALVCPKCSATLKPLNVSKRFACPACGEPLEGHVVMPVALGIFLWSIIEVVIKYAIDPHPDVFTSLLGIGFGACIGLPLMLWLIGRMGTVNSIDEKSRSGRERE